MNSQRQDVQKSAGELLKSGRFHGNACARIVGALQEIADADTRSMPQIERDLLGLAGLRLRDRAEVAGIAFSDVHHAMPAAPLRKKPHPMA